MKTLTPRSAYILQSMGITLYQDRSHHQTKPQWQKDILLYLSQQSISTQHLSAYLSRASLSALEKKQLWKQIYVINNAN